MRETEKSDYHVTYVNRCENNLDSLNFSKVIIHKHATIHILDASDATWTTDDTEPFSVRIIHHNLDR